MSLYLNNFIEQLVLETGMLITISYCHAALMYGMNKKWDHEE